MDTKQLLEAVEVVQAIKSVFGLPPNPWVPVVAAIGGALVGGFAAIIPNYIMECVRLRNERINVTAALLSEIRGIISIVEHRQYFENIRKAADFLREKPGLIFKFEVKIPAHYSRVYQAHIGRLGAIDSSLAAKIIEFHQLIDSIVQDISPGGLLAEEGGNLQTYEQLIKISESALLLGIQAIENGKSKSVSLNM